MDVAPAAAAVEDDPPAILLASWCSAGVLVSHGHQATTTTSTTSSQNVDHAYPCLKMDDWARPSNKLYFLKGFTVFLYNVLINAEQQRKQS
jgi:hypothetical protein